MTEEQYYALRSGRQPEILEFSLYQGKKIWGYIIDDRSNGNAEYYIVAPQKA